MSEDRLESLKRWWRDVGNIKPGWVTRDFEWLISVVERLRGDMGIQKAFIEGFKVDMEERDATIATLREALEAREHDWGPHANKCGWCYELYSDHRDDCMRQKALATAKEE